MESAPRAAVLYRTNFQSRLFEESLRRYGLKYNVVGGFSFYERAEIKDMISYLKLVNNVDDSIALMRVVNTPVRGIGKSTMETVERIALETGLTLWAAIAHAISGQLLPARACAALKNFKEIIDEARAMLFGDFTSQLAASLQPEAREDTSFEIAASAEEGDNTKFNFGAIAEGQASPVETAAEPGFRAPGGSATLPEVLKFLIDRSGYIKSLESEQTPEAFARIENLQELVNAARDSRDRAETLDEFLDHAALVSDVDQYDAGANITLMTLHAAKGLEFQLVCLVGLEEGLFPHSRTLMDPDGLEEERRLCYVGMTRAMDTLIVSRARYRRRYGNDMPEASVPSRFLEEIPQHLFEEIGTNVPQHRAAAFQTYDFGEKHYTYEDEDQSANRYGSASRAAAKKKSHPGNSYNSVDNIAEFFASRGKKFTAASPTRGNQSPSSSRSFRPGQKVKHPKYGEGTVYQREGEGDSAKITVQFPRFGLKKLVEKYAQLEKA